MSDSLLAHRYFYLIILLGINFYLSSAQEYSAGVNTENPNPNAVLHLVAPNGNQGLMVPKLTTLQRESMNLSDDDNGLLVFDETESSFYFWSNQEWLPVGTGNGLWEGSTDVLFTRGNVGIDTSDPQSLLQIGNTLGIDHFISEKINVEGDMVASGVRVDKSVTNDHQLIRLNNNAASMLFLSDGTTSFLKVAAGAEGSSIILDGDASEIRPWLEFDDNNMISLNSSARIRNELAEVALDIETFSDNPAVVIRHNGNDGVGLFVDLTQGANASPGIEISSGNASPGLRINGESPIQIVEGAQSGYVLTSDASGFGTWQPSVSGTFSIPVGDDGNNFSFGSTVGSSPLASTTNFQLAVVAPQGKSTLTSHAYGQTPEIRFSRTNGTQGGGESSINANDIIGDLAYAGFEPGGTYIVTAGVRASATQAWTGASLGTSLAFAVTANNANAPEEAMRLDGDGLAVKKNVLLEGHFITTPSLTAVSASVSPSSRVMYINGNVTDIANGVGGQELILIANGTFSVADGASIFLDQNTDFLMPPNSTLHLIFDENANAWLEIGRSERNP